MVVDAQEIDPLFHLSLLDNIVHNIINTIVGFFSLQQFVFFHRTVWRGYSAEDVLQINGVYL